MKRFFEWRIRCGVVAVVLLIVGVVFLPIAPSVKDVVWGGIGLSAGVISALWTWWWPRVPARIPIFLMLHSVSDAVVDPECANNTLRPSELETLIGNLLVAGYTFKTVSEAAEKAGRRSVVLSFDDGYVDNYLYLFPILKKYGVKATCYITNRGETDSTFLTPAQVREMDASGLVEFGGHTAHHTKLDLVPFATAKAEIEANVAWLTKVLGKAPKTFAYPCGGYTDEVIDVVRSVGYRTAVTMHKKMRAVSDNPLLIHRQIIPRDKTPWQAYALATRGKYRL